MSLLGMLVFFFGMVYIGETTRDDIVVLHPNPKCVVVFEGECVTHEDIQRPDGLLDLDKARAVGFIK